MYWHSWQDFIHMSESGFYVWSAIISCVLAVGCEHLILLKQANQAHQKIIKRHKFKDK